MSLTSIVHYGTNEQRFIGHCLSALTRVSTHVIATYSDKFFDGAPERLDLIEETKSNFKTVNFVGFKWRDGSPKYWHQTSRLEGFKAMSADDDLTMFVDADEILDVDRFLAWLPTMDFDAGMMAAYWYFREAKFRATTWEQPVLLVKTNILRKKMFVGQQERPGIFSNTDCSKREMVTGLDGLPMFHHYSWVRSKEEMLRKVTTWGHRRRKNWVPLVEKEFSHPFDGTDFVHGYKYAEVEPFVNL